MKIILALVTILSINCMQQTPIPEPDIANFLHLPPDCQNIIAEKWLANNKELLTSLDYKCIKTLEGYPKVIRFSKDRCMETLEGYSKVVKINDNTLALIYKNIIELYSIDGELLYTLSGHTRDVISVVPINADTIASASEDGTVRFWNINTGECTNRLTGHTKILWDLVKINHNTIASSDCDGTVKIWDTETAECKKSLSMGTRLCVVNDQTIISSYANRIFLYSMENDNLITKDDHSDTITVLEKIDEETFASGSLKGEIILWKTTGEKKETLPRHSCRTTSIKKVNSKTLVSGGYRGEILIWSLSDLSWPQHMIRDDIGINKILVLDDQTIAYGGSKIKFFSINKLQETREFLSDHTSYLHDLLKVDSNTIASRDKDGKTKIWKYPNISKVLNNSSPLATLLVLLNGTDLSVSCKDKIIESIGKTGEDKSESIKKWITSIPEKNTRQLVREVFKTDLYRRRTASIMDLEKTSL